MRTKLDIGHYSNCVTPGARIVCCGAGKVWQEYRWPTAGCSAVLAQPLGCTHWRSCLVRGSRATVPYQYVPVLSTLTTTATTTTTTMVTNATVIWEKGGIAVTSLPNSSFVFARWQHKTDDFAAICNCVIWMRLDIPNLPFPKGVRYPQLTQCVVVPRKCTCQMASNSVERFKQVARM